MKKNLTKTLVVLFIAIIFVLGVVSAIIRNGKKEDGMTDEQQEYVEDIENDVSENIVEEPAKPKEVKTFWKDQISKINYQLTKHEELNNKVVVETVEVKQQYVQPKVYKEYPVEKPVEEVEEQVEEKNTDEADEKVVDPNIEPNPYCEEISKEPMKRYTEDDIIVVAKTIYGEGNFLPEDEKAQIAWCICNRANSDKYPDDISDVATQKMQFHGYRTGNPVTEENYAIAVDVLDRWDRELNGEEVERELGEEYLYFYGDGAHNHYRKSW